MKILYLFVYVYVFVALPIDARNIQVCSSCVFKTLKAAVKDAEDGDKIYLQAGTYKEHNIEISKSLTITSNQGAILDGEFIGTILRIEADYVTISNLKLINGGRSYTKDFAGILVHRSNNFVIKNNILKDVYFGIKIERSKRGVIEGNTVSSKNTEQANSGNGIHAWHSSEINISDNELIGMRDGIYFEFVKNSIIKNNTSHHNMRYGLHFMFSDQNSYLDNMFNNNGAGVAIMFSKFTVMKHNTFRNNWGTASYGLLLKEIYDSEISDNLFFKNTIAVNIEGSTRINYFSNVFKENGWAIKVTGACYKNIFSGNNFIGNALDVSYYNKANDNKFEGNYWSSYAGYDLDRDGIGDVPHRPVKLFSFIVNRTPEAIVLLRSLFVELINFSEKISPIFTPDDIVDNYPAMRAFE